VTLFCGAVENQAPSLRLAATARLLLQLLLLLLLDYVACTKQ
jgi:hypothetical protein